MSVLCCCERELVCECIICARPVLVCPLFEKCLWFCSLDVRRNMGSSGTTIWCWEVEGFLVVLRVLSLVYNAFRRIPIETEDVVKSILSLPGYRFCRALFIFDAFSLITNEVYLWFFRYRWLVVNEYWFLCCFLVKFKGAFAVFGDGYFEIK